MEPVSESRFYFINSLFECMENCFNFILFVFFFFSFFGIWKGEDGDSLSRNFFESAYSGSGSMDGYIQSTDRTVRMESEEGREPRAGTERCKDLDYLRLLWLSRRRWRVFEVGDWEIGERSGYDFL